MRFLFVSNFERNEDSGAAGSILAIGDALSRRGHGVDFIWKGAERRRTGHPRLFELFELPSLQLRQVGRQLAVAAYDVVIVSQPYAYLVFERLAELYPTTIFLNRTHGWEARLDALEREIGPWMPQRFWRTPLIRAAAAARRSACSRSARSAHGIISASSPCAEFIVRTCNVPVERVATIPYGLDENFLTEEGARREVSQTVRMLYVGQYLPRKGSTTLERVLPDVLRRNPQVTMTFVVQDSVVTEIRDRFLPLLGERLTVSHWTDRSAVRRIYAKHDLLLFPSLFEGFGKTFLEAMACGMCVVGYAEGGLGDICTSGVDALYCTPGDEPGLVSLLESAVRNPCATREIGQHAQGRARQYSWEKTAEATELFVAAVRERVCGRLERESCR